MQEGGMFTFACNLRFRSADLFIKKGSILILEGAHLNEIFGARL